MSGVGGLLVLGREAAAWFAGLAIPSKLTVVTIAVATTGVGVAVVAPDALPISPFASSHHVSLPAVASTVRSAVPVNPSIVASAKPAVSSTPRATTSTPSAASTVPGAGESEKGRASASPSTPKSTKSTAKATTTKPTSSASVYYKDCEAAWEAGAAPIPKGKPGYRAELDPDLNGVACEKRS